jgi:hypothetical protein
MPMVATNTTTRGAFFKRRITVISTAAPKTRPMKSAMPSATQNGTSYWRTRRDNVTAPITPMLPTAKLMIRVARYTRTTPTAITAIASPCTTPS